MPKLPIISGLKLIKALSKVGYLVDHQTASHFILRHIKAPHRRLTVPNHAELQKGTLRAIIRQGGIDIEELIELID